MCTHSLFVARCISSNNSSINNKKNFKPNQQCSHITKCAHKNYYQMNQCSNTKKYKICPNVHIHQIQTLLIEQAKRPWYGRPPSHFRYAEYVLCVCGCLTETPTIIDPNATIKYPSATGSIIVGISVFFVIKGPWLSQYQTHMTRPDLRRLAMQASCQKTFPVFRFDVFHSAFYAPSLGQQLD